MLFDPNNPIHVEQAYRALGRLISKGKVFEIREPSFITPSQRNYLNMLIGLIAVEIGESFAYVKEELLKKYICEDIFAYEDEDGNVAYRSSEKISSENVSYVIDRLKTWARNEGFVIPEKEDRRTLLQLKAELERTNKYL